MPATVDSFSHSLSVLPPWFQAILNVLIFIATGYAYYQGLFKKLPTAKDSKDVIVPSISIADSQTIQGWIDTLKEGNRYEKDNAEHLFRIVMLLELILKRVEQVEHALKNRD